MTDNECTAAARVTEHQPPRPLLAICAGAVLPLALAIAALAERGELGALVTVLATLAWIATSHRSPAGP